MICPSCGSDNIEGADECTNCGAALYGLTRGGREAPDFIHDPLSSVPLREAPRLTAVDPVSYAVSEMRRTDSNSVLVMDGQKLAGIITGWDIVQKVAGPTEDLNAITCSQIMTENPRTLHQEDTIAHALNVMAGRGFRHVPIVNDEGPIGVIIAADLFRHVSPQLV